MTREDNGRRVAGCSRRGAAVMLAAIMLAGGFVRTAGLYRGQDSGLSFHPDATKQVDMLREYLSGNPVRYRDSWFYDGYPYGLNVLDAVLIRCAQAASLPWVHWVDPGARQSSVPALSDLFRWCGLLRVLYGLLTIGLVYAAVRRFGAGRVPALAAAALCAAAPLGATVTHSVTGDIGVDLFLAAALWCAAAYGGTARVRWLVLLGLACGMAFACKYQGALGLWMAGAGLLLAGPYVRPWFGRLLGRGLATAGGFLAGAFALTPALWVDAERAWNDILINFVRIKDYEAPDHFEALSFAQRLWYGLSGNLPLVLQSLGWGLAVLALLALVRMMMEWRRAVRSGDATAAAMRLAVVSLPLVALLLSTALKPAVQPFHFSYLVPVMAVSAALLLPGLRPRALAAALVIFALGESLWASRRETFFWYRDEIIDYGQGFSDAVFETPVAPDRLEQSRRTLKTFYVEPARLSVFRNRTSTLQLEDAPWWQARHLLPVPTVAWPRPDHWVFLNGPVFPRSDREFLVPASGPRQTFRAHDVNGVTGTQTMVFTRNRKGWWLDRTLVLNQAPGPVRVGLRSGRWPVRFELQLAEQRRHGFLLPHQQAILDFAPPRAAFRSAATAEKPASFVVTFRARAQLGPVWVALLADEQERAVYEAFGPDPSGAALPPLSAEELERRLQELRYLDGARPIELATEPQRLYGDGHPLAAGAYRVDARVVNTGSTRTLRMVLRDAHGFPSGVPPFETTVEPGTHDVQWRFAKDFAPYDADLLVNADAPGLRMEKWSLKPDALALADWPAGRPAAPPEPGLDGLITFPAGLQFPGIGTLRQVAWPERVAAGDSLAYTTQWTLDPGVPHKVFHDAVVFLHLKNEQGRTVMLLDYPLREVSLAEERVVFQHATLPVDLAPGRYSLYGGVYDAVTRHRHALKAPPGIPTKGDAARLADIMVAPPVL